MRNVPSRLCTAHLTHRDDSGKPASARVVVVRLFPSGQCSMHTRQCWISRVWKDAAPPWRLRRRAGLAKARQYFDVRRRRVKSPSGMKLRTRIWSSSGRVMRVRGSLGAGGGLGDGQGDGAALRALVLALALLSWELMLRIFFGKAEELGLDAPLSSLWDRGRGSVMMIAVFRKVSEMLFRCGRTRIGRAPLAGALGFMACGE